MGTATAGRATTAGVPVDATVFRTAAAATRADSARIVISSSTTSGSGRPYSFTQQGSFDFRTSTGSFTSTYPGAADDEVLTVYVGQHLYTRRPGSTLPRPWTETDLSALPFGVTDSGSTLTNLATAVSDVRRVGPVRLGDTPTTRYTATVDPVAALGPDASAAGIADVRGAGITSDTVEVWVDARGRYRRVATHVVATSFPSVSGDGGRGPATSTTVQDLTDQGVAVHASAPPASTVSRHVR